MMGNTPSASTTAMMEYGTYALILLQPDLSDPGIRAIAYNTRMRGRIHDGNPTDDYVFDAVAGDTISIHVDSTGNLFPSLELISSSGEFNSQRTILGIHNAIDTSNITLEENGEYTIRVGRSGGEWGRYALELKWVSFVESGTGQDLDDLPTLWAETQLAEARGQVQDRILDICDVAVTAGAGSVAKGVAAGGQVVATEVMKDILTEISVHLAKEGITATTRWVSGFLLEKELLTLFHSGRWNF